MANSDKKRNQILNATLMVMASNNSTDFTIREVASIANVNVASINYYFESKAQLVAEVERFFFANYQDAFSPLYDERMSSEDKLKRFLGKCIYYLELYPAILVVMRDKFAGLKGNGYELLQQDLDNKFKLIEKLFINVFNPQKDASKHLLMFFSTVITPFIIGDWIKSDVVNDIGGNHIKYIEFCFENYKKLLVR